ncbi:MAG: hypothetical protein K6T71_01075 [Candidatus Bipolaricaulota bacterium]|nr:hypothetical protein [Candidatus Bipolaricaulota bacterium]
MKRTTSASLAGGAVEFHLTGQLPYAASYDTRSGEWHVTVGPQIPEAVDSIGNQFLTELIFRALLMESLEGQQRFELHRETRFELPKGAVFTNRQELEGLKWNLDFGGGTSLRATLKLENQAVTVVEDLIQTEAEPTNLMTEEGRAALFDSLGKYKSFVIRYAQDPQIATPLAPKPVTTQSRPDSFSRSWQFSARSPTLSVTFDGLPRGSSFTLSSTASFTLGGFIGWRFSRSGLEWFDAKITTNPSLNLTASVNVPLLNWQRSRGRVWGAGADFWFWIGVLPVYIRLQADIDVLASLAASGTTQVSFNTGLGISSTTGVLYNRLGVNPGWRPQRSSSMSASQPSVRVTTSVGITASAGPSLTLSAYLYGLAGPFVRLGVSLGAELNVRPSRTWGLKGLAQASGGFKTSSWLRNFLGIDISLNYNFYTLERSLAMGTW